MPFSSWYDFNHMHWHLWICLHNLIYEITILPQVHPFFLNNTKEVFVKSYLSWNITYLLVHLLFGHFVVIAVYISLPSTLASASHTHDTYKKQSTANKLQVNGQLPNTSPAKYITHSSGSSLGIVGKIVSLPVKWCIWLEPSVLCRVAKSLTRVKHRSAPIHILHFQFSFFHFLVAKITKNIRGAMDPRGKSLKYDQISIQHFKLILALIVPRRRGFFYFPHTVVILVIVCRADGYLKAVLILNWRGRAGLGGGTWTRVLTWKQCSVKNALENTWRRAPSAHTEEVC